MINWKNSFWIMFIIAILGMMTIAFNYQILVKERTNLMKSYENISEYALNNWNETLLNWINCEDKKFELEKAYYNLNNESYIYKNSESGK